MKMQLPEPGKPGLLKEVKARRQEQAWMFLRCFYRLGYPESRRPPWQKHTSGWVQAHLHITIAPLLKKSDRVNNFSNKIYSFYYNITYYYPTYYVLLNIILTGWHDGLVFIT